MTGPDAVGAQPDDFIAKLVAALASGKPFETMFALQTICNRTRYLLATFDAVERIMREHDQLELFKMSLLDSIGAANHLSATMKRIGGFAAQEGFADDLQDATKAGGIAVFTPGTGPFAPRIVLDPNHITLGGLVDQAHSIADKLSVDPRLLDKLFAHRQMVDMPREAWERQFRIAEAMELITQSIVKANLDLRPLMHPKTRQRTLDAMPAGRAALYVTAHVGFTAPRNYIIRKYLRKSIAFRRQRNKQPYAWQLNDARTALFSCIRAMSENISIIIAPDGPLGTARSTVPVLGNMVSMGTGGVVMAHETKSDVFWIGMEFSDEGFVPAIIKGPSPDPKEPLKAYTARFTAFYETMLHQYFTGHPRNLVVRKKLAAVLLGETGEEAPEI